MDSAQRVCDYLIARLYEHGVRHVFGVPGDYVLGFLHELEQSPLQVVNTCDEQGAGFAADAYARLRGLGVVCVTYCVGGLKVANTTAQAFAEKSPVVVISGAPGRTERVKNPLLHHRVRDFDTQLKVFEQLTVAATVLNDPQTAFREIDRVLAAALRYKRPVYIELPRDMLTARGRPAHTPTADDASDPDALREALAEAARMINAARQPVLIAGVELHRFGLQDTLVQLIETLNMPTAASIQSKSVLAEQHPLFIGIYEGAMGYEDVRTYVESSDCVILLGAFMSDIDLGIGTARLDQGRSISVTSEKTSIRYHFYESIRLDDFMRGLLGAGIRRRTPGPIPHPAAPAPFVVAPGQPVTVQRLFQRLNSFLDDETVVIADPGDAMFAGVDLFIQSRTEFLSPAYYTSLGFAVPAGLGVQLANPQLRPLVLVGDGAFQMTGMELSTVARFQLNPIVVVLNNRGYGTERPMQDGSFNDVLLWRFSRIPEILGAGKGFDVHTEDELDAALHAARAYIDGFSILDVHLDPKDCSKALQRMTASLRKRISPPSCINST
ncbi:MAG TPA: thiamine pyrophosphate-binding protein [Candidatus Acidoferrales bacterium]|nr:thiamine pyrophosphate-binding protein [Candidatus Acidoferrales bacterium]